MEAEGKTIELLPNELIDHVFTYLKPRDLVCVSYVSKSWYEQANNDHLWAEIKKQFISDIKYWQKYDWEFFYKKEHKSLADYILNIEKWPKDNIETLLLDANLYKVIELILIKHLEGLIVAKAIELKIDSPAKLLSFFHVHRVVNLFSAPNAAIIAANDAAIDAYNNRPVKMEITDNQNAERQSAWSIAMNAAYEAANKEFWNSARHAAYHAINNNSCNIIYKTIYDVVNKLILNNYLNAFELYRRSLLLANIYGLAYVCQKSFIDIYFKPSYDAVLSMKNHPNFTKEDILNIISADTWSNIELNSNPYINSLEIVMKTVARGVNN